MNIIQDHTSLRHVGTLPQDTSKYNSSFCRRHFDSSFDTLETMWCKRINSWSFNNFQIAERSEIQAEILKGIGRLIDEKDVEKYIKTVHFDVGLRINGVGETYKPNKKLAGAFEISIKKMTNRSIARYGWDLTWNLLELHQNLWLDRHLRHTTKKLRVSKTR